ncbi:MAG TPA: uracil-DNA glycosylase [Gemmataceae bacterium]|nr:uracil-DNA glycosylase [Gemmataceae bacterium]
MPEQPEPTPAELARQLRQHLDSLRTAGIHWLPASGTPAESAPSPEATAQPTLFAAANEPTPSSGIEQRRQELTMLAERVSTCQRCTELVVSRSRTVFGIGPLDAELCFVGEAPGATEDQRGEPFVGEAGQLLDRIIAACGMKREEVYICNICKCRPPGNRLPTSSEAGNCREYLERQIELVRPKFLCALGACAAQNLLGTTQGIGRLRGRFHDFKGIPVMCTYHPAFLLPGRSPHMKKEVWNDMKKLLERMGRPIPQR